MLERIKYNFWQLLFIGNTLAFLFFLYQAASFTSVFAYRWVFFLATPFFTSGIHLLIKSRSTRAEWLSIVNFGTIALMIVYFNAFPDSVKLYWTWFSIPIVNQLTINSFDVLWSGKYPFKWSALIAICIIWFMTILSIAFKVQALMPLIIVLVCITGFWCLFIVFLEDKKVVK
ncbi:MAG: hypothetical protein FJY06_02560 [Bacteroidetes bacterium]|nr:hypothetical protein [Bacteroidota bacterium]